MLGVSERLVVAFNAIRRRTQQIKVIESIKKFQNSGYKLKVDRRIQEWICFSARRGGEKYLQISRYLEPGKQFAGVASDGIPREIMTKEEKSKDRLRILLLGLPSSGKSTLYKQCIHLAPSELILSLQNRSWF